MENAVLKASGGSALQFPLAIGDRCIVGPHAYVVGATIGNGCFVADRREDFQRRDARATAAASRSARSFTSRLALPAASERSDAARRLRRSGDDLSAREGARGSRQDRLLRRRLQPRSGRATCAPALPRPMPSSSARRTRRTRPSKSIATSSPAAAPLRRGAAADAGHGGGQGRRRHDARARRDGASPAAGDQTAKGRLVPFETLANPTSSSRKRRSPARRPIGWRSSPRSGRSCCASTSCAALWTALYAQNAAPHRTCRCTA